MWFEAEDERFVRYLLGGLSSEEREELENEFIADGAVHERLLAIECELVDAYVLAQLSSVDRKAFERQFLSSPEGRQRVDRARLTCAYFSGVFRVQVSPAFAPTSIDTSSNDVSGVALNDNETELVQSVSGVQRKARKTFRDVLRSGVLSRFPFPVPALRAVGVSLALLVLSLSLAWFIFSRRHVQRSAPRGNARTIFAEDASSPKSLPQSDEGSRVPTVQHSIRRQVPELSAEARSDKPSDRPHMVPEARYRPATDDTDIEPTSARPTGVRRNPEELQFYGALATPFSIRRFHDVDSSDALTEPGLWEAVHRSERAGEWDDAIALVNRILTRNPTGLTLDTASRKLIYLLARKKGKMLFDAGDFKGGAAANDQAFSIDRFSFDSAFAAVNGYLLSDALDDAVHVLHDIRARGNSEDVAKANAMLMKLADVHPGARAELAASIPTLPSIGEIFGDIRFGLPDFESARQYIYSNPADIGAWTKDIAASAPPPPVASLFTAYAVPGSRQEVLPPPDPKAFRVDVISAGGPERNLLFRRTGGQSPGTIVFDGPPGTTPIVVDGTVRSLQVPFSLALPAGKYVIRTMKDGQELDKKEVEVKPLGITNVSVKK